MKKNEIQNFKNILEERKKAILENLQSNSNEIEALHNSVPSDSVDFSVIETGSQIDFAISTNLKEELIEIEDSLDKIKNGTYGICESCDENRLSKTKSQTSRKILYHLPSNCRTRKKT